jgi:hypothetical protein
MQMLRSAGAWLGTPVMNAWWTADGRHLYWQQMAPAGGASVGRPTLDQPRWRGRLHDNVLAGPAGVFGPAHHEQPELNRHDVEALAHVLADPMQCALAARAGMVVMAGVAGSMAWMGLASTIES